MNQKPTHEQLEDVLYQYLEVAPNPDYATLQAWITRYPEFAQELTEFTVAQNRMQGVPEYEASPEEINALVQFGQQTFQSLLAQGTNAVARASTAGIESLLAAGKTIGKNLQHIAQETRLSVSLVRMLDRRLIKADSIPNAVVDSLANVFGYDSRVMSTYLHQPPVLAQGVRYRSEQVPTLAQTDFQHAITDDQSLSEADRAYWLSTLSEA
jgi:hypothetical protein